MSEEARDAELLEKKRALYREQKELLETFLANGALTEAQFRKSFGDLTEKMGMEDYLRSLENEGRPLT